MARLAGSYQKAVYASGKQNETPIEDITDNIAVRITQEVSQLKTRSNAALLYFAI